MGRHENAWGAREGRRGDSTTRLEGYAKEFSRGDVATTRARLSACEAR